MNDALEDAVMEELNNCARVESMPALFVIKYKHRSERCGGEFQEYTSDSIPTDADYFSKRKRLPKQIFIYHDDCSDSMKRPHSVIPDLHRSDEFTKSASTKETQCLSGSDSLKRAQSLLETAEVKKCTNLIAAEVEIPKLCVAEVEIPKDKISNNGSANNVKFII
jgi:hypothetical protein